MTSLITLPNDHFAVTVESDAKSFVINDTNLLIYEHSFDRIGLGTDEFKQLPPGSYTIVAPGSEISEQQAGEIVEYWKGIGWRDYTSLMDELATALESFRSLLASHSLDKNVLIIKQNK